MSNIKIVRIFSSMYLTGRQKTLVRKVIGIGEDGNDYLLELHERNLDYDKKTALLNTRK